MVRTDVYLTETQHQGLRRMAHRTGRSQSELIREAVDALLSDRRPASRLELLRRGRGLWAQRDDLPDFRERRAELDRG